MGFLEKIFGDLNEKEIKKIEKTADQIMALEPEMQKRSDEELAALTVQFRERLAAGETLDDILVEAYAAVREAAWRTLEMKHFRVQLIGGVVLHQGRIAEMKTGEGKTLVATLPVYLNALEGKGVHVVTVNDYLAQRDMEWMGAIYTFLGLTVGCVTHGVTGSERREAYQADITYGTNNEFGFDYLRDNMVTYQEDQVQRELNYAIVDEVDSILIDEARTPLIISGQGDKSTDLYQIADRFVAGFTPGFDFTVEEKDKTVSLTEQGVTKSEKHFKVDNLSDPENMELNHHIIQALKARSLMRRDIDYIVKDGEIVIVDEFTGRLMFGRRYSDGLHQAIEAKEGMKVREESKTLATITLQNYFRMFKKLAGMTGTAKTEEDEFRDIYNMDVVVIPTNKPVVRNDLDDAIYSTERGKFTAIANSIAACHERGQPVLVGTISIERSELISSMLKRRGIKHNVLNAKQHDREAEIVAEAGRYGAVTIATNMAGRGTDIILGGRGSTPEERQRVVDLGGLYIVGTERHESRRIDNQLRGRSGRQGDPGTTQFFISLEDDLMRLFGGDRIQGLVGKLGMDDSSPLEAGMLTKSIENAQKKVEGRNFSIRKYVLQYDDVMNKQREIIYSERRRVLLGEDLREHIMSMAGELAQEQVDYITNTSKYSEEWDLEELTREMRKVCESFPAYRYSEEEREQLDRRDLYDDTMATLENIYAEKEAEIGVERMRELERMVLLRVVDNKWMDHIDAMDQLRYGIGLRALGQQDPARAYADEGFDMFELMIKSIKDDTVRLCFNVTVQTNAERRQVASAGEGRKEEIDGRISSVLNSGAGGPQAMPAAAPVPQREHKQETVRKQPTAGRNDPCPCGSGKKYKKCCGANKIED
ncbi:MAG TPA: preprotein translocase subunit SecA [Clostridiales bacterium]|jgi:preprotein translocase subunit SecA|nr:preprotein translocase subunit SecA [Clostridiales bacterium]